MKLKFINKMMAIMCAVSISATCIAPSVGAIKAKGEVSQAASKRIGELNNRMIKCCDQLKKAKDEIEQLKTKLKVKNQRTEFALNNAIQGINSSIKIIEELDNVLLDNSVNDIEVEDDLNNLSSRFRVLDYLLDHCKVNQEGNSFEFIESNEIKLEEHDELSLEETAELNKDLESSSVTNVLFKRVVSARNRLNEIKNKITKVADSCDKDVINIGEKSDIKDKNSNNEELFKKLDELYGNTGEDVKTKTTKTIDILKKTFSKPEEARLRAMVAFDVINKYEKQGADRDLIIKELVESVVKEEMELSFNRCCENSSPVIVEKFKGIDKNQLIKNSISIAYESKTTSLYEFCCVAFYGTDIEYGFYEELDKHKKYWYDKYSQSKDNMTLPIIVDMVELNSLVLRLEELEHIRLNADNIRKISKIFDEIFNSRLDNKGTMTSEGMYRHLTGKSYTDHLDKEQKYVGKYPLLNELRCGFMDIVNNLLADGDNDTSLKMKERIHKSIEKVKSIVKQVDDKYAKLGTEFDIPRFTPESNKTLYNMRLDFYEEMIDYEKWKTDNNLNNLFDADKLAIDVMVNFRKNKYKAQFKNLTSEEFIKSFEESQRRFIEHVQLVQKWQIYHEYRREVNRFLIHMQNNYDESIRQQWPNLFCRDSIFSMAMRHAPNYYGRVSQNPSDQNILRMEAIVNHSIADMNNIRQYPFILDHEKRVKVLMDNFQFDENGKCLSGDRLAEQLRDNVVEFRRYYDEHRYDLCTYDIQYLESLAEYVDNGLKIFFDL